MADFIPIEVPDFSVNTIRTPEGTVHLVTQPRDWSDVIRMWTGQEVGLYREFSEIRRQGALSWALSWVCATYSERFQEYTIWSGQPIPRGLSTNDLMHILFDWIGEAGQI